MNELNTYTVPISVKGIVIEDGKVWLRKNERNLWEIPGGKLDRGEQPTETVIRELREELGFETKVIGILQAHLFRVEDSLDESHGVLVITYHCKLIKAVGTFELEGEGGKAEFEQFAKDEIKDLPMPQFYKDAIKIAFNKYDL